MHDIQPEQALRHITDGQNFDLDTNSHDLREDAYAQLALLQSRARLPDLVPHLDLVKRSIHTPQGFAALVHAIAHIEYNAIRLAYDAVWRFDGLPHAYYADWTRVAQEERKHFDLLQALLQTLGYAYGDFQAHTGLWDMCAKTQNDVVARMALVPRTLEARGLDATPLIQSKLKKIQTQDARAFDAILDVILHDEIGHVAIGNHWYRWLCQRESLDPITHYKMLAKRYEAPRFKPPINTSARLQAGFLPAELDALAQESAQRPTKSRQFALSSNA